MNIKLLAVLFAILIVGGAVLREETLVPQPMLPQENAIKTNEKLVPFPDLVFKTDGGQELRVRDMKEKTILIHFWAAWCDVCHAEFPALLKYVENSHGKIALLSISLDDHYEDSAKLLSKLEEKYHVTVHSPHLYWVWDQDKSLSLHAFNTVKVPETIVINQDRMMVDKIVGAGPWAEAAGGP